MTPVESQRPLLIRVVIPHFYIDSESNQDVAPIGQGFGSRNAGVGGRWRRASTFQNCLYSLLNLRRTTRDWILDLKSAVASESSNAVRSTGYESISLEIVVATVGNQFLSEVIESVYPQAKLLAVDLDDPRYLGIKARDWLIYHPSPADLNIYMEDDLVIHDPQLPEKIIWIAEKTSQSCVLFPHRYELTRMPGSLSRLYIDGAIDQDELTDWHSPQDDFARGSYRGEHPVVFDVPSNPHSGFFALTREQVLILKHCDMPVDGFVSPLETAATYTVGYKFKILKPSLLYRRFLEIEHSFPSYLGYLAS